MAPLLPDLLRERMDRFQLHERPAMPGLQPTVSFEIAKIPEYPSFSDRVVKLDGHLKLLPVIQQRQVRAWRLGDNAPWHVRESHPCGERQCKEQPWYGQGWNSASPRACVGSQVCVLLPALSSWPQQLYRRHKALRPPLSRYFCSCQVNQRETVGKHALPWRHVERSCAKQTLRLKPSARPTAALPRGDTRRGRLRNPPPAWVYLSDIAGLVLPIILR